MHLKTWEPAIDQTLPCIPEPDNLEDTNAFVVIMEEKQLGMFQKYYCMSGNVTETLVQFKSFSSNW